MDQPWIDQAKFKSILSRAIGLPIFLMILLAATLLWQIFSLFSAARLVDHTDQVIAQSQIIQKLILDRETSLRGYVITGEENFLEPYNQAGSVLDAEFDRFETLLSDDTIQLTQAKELRKSYSDWNSYAKAVISMRRIGSVNLANIITAEGKQRMDLLRAQMSTIIQEQEGLRNNRSRVAQRVARITIGTSIGLTVLIGCFIVFAIKRQLISLSQSYKGALSEVVETREWLSTTLTSIGDGVIATDEKGRISFINPIAQSLTGWHKDDAIGRSIKEIFSVVGEDETVLIEDPVAKVLASGTITRLGNHTVLIKKDGTRRFIDDSGAPIKDRFGKIIGAVLIFRDVTERRELEQERKMLLLSEQEARREAEEANRLKDEFLATVSHELRTPLTSIFGWIKLLRQGRLSGKTIDHALEVLDRNARTQAQLIEDILDVSRIITGKLQLDIQPLELASVIEAAISTVRPAAVAKEIKIATVIDSDIGQVYGDSVRLQQVVWNLLSNAIKFTPKGGRVEVRLQQTDSQSEIVVQDSGEGISTDFLPYVFDRFRQADGSTTRKQGGLGIGLSIVRHITELHGGSVSVESQGKDRGTTFRVKLPLKKREPDRFDTLMRQVKSVSSVAVVSPPLLDGLRVLIVDDEADSRDIVALVIAQSNAKVKTAGSAREALSILDEWRPDLLISDIGMPEVDGYELIKKVRARAPESGGRIPAVALTAYARLEDRNRAVSAGFNMFAPKPIEPEELIRIVSSLIEGREPQRHKEE